MAAAAAVSSSIRGDFCAPCSRFSASPSSSAAPPPSLLLRFQSGLRSSSTSSSPALNLNKEAFQFQFQFQRRSPMLYSPKTQIPPPPQALGIQQGQGRRLIGKSMRWWEKGVQPNMKEIESTDDLVTSLLTAGDTLVIVDFFSPGCGGCKALHPKICQFAEMTQEVQFLQVNYEEHKSMCYSLNVHVLPFFRFYRGAQGRLCSFSCTNATIKKFKDALAKHGTERCSLGPPKGLEESELLALASNKDLGFTYYVSSEKEKKEKEKENHHQQQQQGAAALILEEEVEAFKSTETPASSSRTISTQQEAAAAGSEEKELLVGSAR